MEEQAMSLNDLKAVLLRRTWGLLIPFCVIFWLGVITAFLLPSIYRSTATILIEEQDIPTNLVQTTVTSYAQQRLQNIYQRIISTSHLQKIIEELNILPELRSKMTSDEIAAKMRDDIVLDFIHADVIDPKTGREASVTIAFTLSYQGKEPEQTQRVASVLTSLFLEENLKDREKSVSQASSFLQEEVNRVKEEMTEIDAKIALYKEKHLNDLPELFQVNMQSLQNIEVNRDRLYEQMRSLREREGYLVSQLASIPRQQMQTQKNRLEELQVQLANLKTRFSDQYPDVIAVKEEIKKLSAEKSMAKEETPDNPVYITMAAQLASTKSEIASLAKQIAANDEKAAIYRRSLQSTPRVEETYKVLINERDNLLNKYNDLMQKHMEAQVAQGLEKNQKGERFTVVEPALLPEKPYKPNRLAIILIGFVLGIGAGIGTVALLEFNDQSIRTAEALTLATSVPVLGVISEIMDEKEKRKARNKKLLTLAIALLANLVLAIIAFLV